MNIPEAKQDVNFFNQWLKSLVMHYHWP